MKNYLPRLSLLTAALLTAAFAPALSKSSRPSSEEAVDFRDSILQYYGFTSDAKVYIRRNAQVRVLNWDTNLGGGAWDPVKKMVTLQSLQQEAAVRAFSLVWWDAYRMHHKDAALKLAKAVVATANSDDSKALVALARSFVYGDNKRGFVGYFCNMPVSEGLDVPATPSPGCADPKNLKSDDFDLTPGSPAARVLDREMYADLAAWTMGRYATGSHALPKRLWPFFAPLFSGKIYRTPYYDGGIP